MKSSFKAFDPKTQHWRYIYLRKEMGNKIERLNGTVREVDFCG